MMATNGTNFQQPKNRIPSKISAILIDFANCLNPSPEYIKEGKQTVQKVFNILQQQASLNISRSYIGGSVGKTTSIIYPDFDCVVFLNGKYPPLEDMVKDFEKILREKAKELGIDENSFRTSTVTVSLEFSNGVEMDLLPATSFAQNPEEQYKKVLERLKGIKGNNLKLQIGHSSSLAETVLLFMKNQSGATHQLVRLAKYWYKMCTFENYIYGGSTIIEILCVDAAFDSDENGGIKFDMLKAFRKFLKKVSAIHTLKIAFYRDPQNGKFSKVAPTDLSMPKYKSHFPAEIIQRKNFIIEPANPFNDFAPNVSQSSAKRLTYSAKKMLDRLDMLEKLESNEMKQLSPDNREILTIHYDKLFEPFIMNLKEFYPQEIPLAYVEYYYQNYDSAHASALVRNKEYFKNNINAKHVYRTVTNNLLFIIRSKASYPAVKKGLSFTDGVADIVNVKDDVEKPIQAFLDSNVSKVILRTANKDHQDLFVTLTVPYRRKGTIYAVRCSLKW